MKQLLQSTLPSGHEGYVSHHSTKPGFMGAPPVGGGGSKYIKIA